MLTIADVSKSYGTRTLFADVSLFIARSDRYGLVGPNGAGKTTLFNLILGEETADEGTIEPATVVKALKQYGIDPYKPNPVTV